MSRRRSYLDRAVSLIVVAVCLALATFALAIAAAWQESERLAVAASIFAISSAVIGVVGFITVQELLALHGTLHGKRRNSTDDR